PMIGIAHLVQVHASWPIVIRDDHVDVTIVVEIAKCDASRNFQSLEIGTRFSGYFAKTLTLFVMEKLVWLLIGIGFGSLPLDITVGDGEIQPAIVIIIEETRSESGVGLDRCKQTLLRSDLIEEAASIVLI